MESSSLCLRRAPAFPDSFYVHAADRESVLVQNSIRQMTHLRSMPTFIKLLMGFTLMLSTAVAQAQLSTDDVFSKPDGQVISGLPKSHPSAYIAYAARLFKEGRKDQAVHWFYIGGIRYRFYLKARNLESSEESSLLASLQSGVGQMINEWAGGAPTAWVQSIDAALDWDASYPNDYVSKDTYRDAWEQTRSGLVSLKQYIINSRAEIRSKRLAAGLENRERD